MMIKKYVYIACGLLLVLSGPGCSKDEQVFEEPYKQGKEPLGIKIDPTQVPQPAAGNPGTVVSIKGTGMLQYPDKLVFMFHGQQIGRANVRNPVTNTHHVCRPTLD